MRTRFRIPCTDSTVSLSFLVVLIAYAVVFGGLLLYSHGYPYVLDNNESYSNLWHARSLYENGTSETKGLTDEVFSPQAAASPNIHSHQGNFPRLFTFLLYVAGFRSIESQLWITTFTIGLLAFYLAHRFLSGLLNPLFATLACLVLITDYLFVAQWHANLHRVWHLFFFFSSLLCVQDLGDSTRRSRWAWLTLANFAALFYWEYVFTAFVTMLCGLYAVVLYRRRFRLVLLVWGMMAAGATLAAGLLLAQLTAYMGWANVMEDVRLTLTARNAAADPELLERITSFYQEHRIIFWHNFHDASPLRSLGAMWDSLLDYHLKYYGPILLHAVVVLATGWWLGRWRWVGGMLGASPAYPAPDASRNTQLRPLAEDLVKLLLIAACLAGLFTPFFPSLPSLVWLGLALLLGCMWTGQWWGWHRLGWLRFIPMALLVVVADWAGRATAGLLDGELRVQMLASPGGPLILGFEQPLSFLVTLVAFSCAAAGGTPVLGRFARERLAGLLPFLLCGAAAYAFAYRLFTGYIYSGYLHRFAPMPVFLVAPLLGLVFYLALQPLRRIVRPAWRALANLPRALQNLVRASGNRQREQAALESASCLVRILPALALLTAFAGLTANWCLRQATYARIAPADSYSFLTRLDQRAYRGLSLVSNTYPAPMAARLGSWGYADTSLFSGTLTLGPAGFKVERDLKYLWFADRDTNPAYLKPDLALTVVQPPNFSEAMQRYLEWNTPDPDHPPRVENSGLVRRARSLPQPFLRHRLLESDGRRFSLVRMDWDYPPFLQSLEEERRLIAARYSLLEKMALSESGQELQRRWRVEIEPVGNERPVHLLRAECDLLPLFPALVTAEPLAPRRLVQIVQGDRLSLVFERHPAAGTVQVSVNDHTELLDLSTGGTEPLVLELNSAQPHGRFTTLPSFSPGSYVRVQPAAGTGAEVTYAYKHQEDQPENGTIIRVYQESPADHWHLADTITFLGPDGLAVRLDQFRQENPDTLSEYAANRARGDDRTYAQWLTDHLAHHPEERHRTGIVRESLALNGRSDSGAGATRTRFVPLPPSGSGRLQISVAPGTRTKTGPEYFSVPFIPTVVGIAAKPPSVVAAPSGVIPYGRLKMRLRFPERPLHGAEPLLTTGMNEAGDIIYVIYHDPAHIRIGLDHWFKGGPVTPPIPVDRTVEHELEFSLGSLFPPAEDVVFYGTPPETVDRLKRQVLVRLDGRTVLSTESAAYESPPRQVTPGRNTIRGTSAGPEFSGEILSVERRWFE